MRIIPAIDIINGQCVRLTKGDYSTKKVYDSNPLEVAKKFEAHGIQYLHVVDLDGAKAKEIINAKILEEICSKTNLNVDFGGGIKSEKDLQLAFDCGARQVTLGSFAAMNSEKSIEWAEKYGKEKIIIGADFDNGKISTEGWTNSSKHEVMPFVQDFVDAGIHHVISTDITKDGMLMGPSFKSYKTMLNIDKIKLIASGGVRNLEDIEELRSIGCYGVIIGKAIYENKITLKELEKLC